MENRLLVTESNAQMEERQQLTADNQYGSNFEYLCAVIGFAVGYGSFWRFPYLVYEYGSEFVFIYFLILLLFGLPMLYLETALGQMHQESIPFILSRINKGLKWFGLTFVIICFNFSGYYNIILAYSYRYILSVFDSSIRFQDESIKDNKIFAENILHSSDSINEFEGINYTLFFFYVMSIGICYYIIAKGVKQAGKIIVFTALFPYVLFIIMLLRGITLPGAFSGLKMLLEFKGNFFSPTVWFEAITQVFYQLTLACAGIVHMSSMKSKTDPFMKGLYWILASVLTCGLLCAANIFIYLGHFSHMIGVSIHEITLSGPEICFNIFPKALAILPFPRIWLFMFFVVMVLLGIDTMIGAMETIVCYLKDEAKTTVRIFGQKISFSKMKLGLALGYIVFLFPLTSNAGIYYLVWFDRYTVYIPLAVNILFEVYIFVYQFSLEELQNQVEKYTGVKTPSYVKFFLKSKILLIILGFNLLLTVYNQLFVYWHEYTIEFYLLGWVWTLYPYVLAYFYWERNKQPEWRLTFEEIQKTYNTYEHDERTSCILSHDQEMRDIKNKLDFNGLSNPENRIGSNEMFKMTNSRFIQAQERDYRMMDTDRHF